ncbi:hypothetical protein [Pseudomonas massiliensis]|uniref:hypothetical protein n=1 Tax=Pseudomonas massiliensis TaxID=522492 RepID=UPI0006948ED3|nr:hypothetical protein [Pseudomonas massiliensis]
MRKSNYLCTAENRQGIWPDPGMLGRSYTAFPENSVGEFRGGPSIGGYYSIDDYHAALFLAYELGDPDIVMEPDEALEKANLLHDLMQKVQRGGRATLEQLSVLQKAAESIPEIGPLLFSPTSLPGTMVTAGTLVAAASATKPMHQLLDLTNARKKALSQWSRAKGKTRAKAARKLAQGGVKFVTLAGKHYLDVPVTTMASRYLIGGKMPASSALIPASSTRAALMQRAVLKANGARGGLRIASSTIVGTVLAVVPQAIADYTNAKDARDFLRRSTYTQPVNVAALAASWLVPTIVVGIASVLTGGTLPFVVILAIGAMAGQFAQYGLDKTGLNHRVGDYVWGG